MPDLQTLDRIFIRDLVLTCIIGIREAEQRERQNVCLNLEIFLNTRRAAISDAIEDSVDYKSLKLAIKQHLEQTSFKLLERLVAEVAGICLKNEHVAAARVRAGKPGALRWARTVEVEILRRRGETL